MNTNKKIVTTLNLGNRSLGEEMNKEDRTVYKINAPTRDVIVGLYPELKGFKTMLLGDMSDTLKNAFHWTDDQQYIEKKIKKMNINVIEIDFDLVCEAIEEVNRVNEAAA